MWRNAIEKSKLKLLRMEMERKMEKFPVMCIASEATDEWTLCPHPMHVYGYNTAVQCIEHTRMLAFTCLHATSVIRDENNNNNIKETCKDLTENTGKITMTFTLLWFMLFFLFVCQPVYIGRHFAPILFLCCVRDIFFPLKHSSVASEGHRMSLPLKRIDERN